MSDLFEKPVVELMSLIKGEFFTFIRGIYDAEVARTRGVFVHPAGRKVSSSFFFKQSWLHFGELFTVGFSLQDSCFE